MICRWVVEQERNDCWVTVHTSIARGDVWCKKQSFPGLPQTSRCVTEEEEDKKKREKKMMKKKSENCV